MIAGLPWWVFIMILLIFLCGYMAFRAIKAEKELDQHYIENEGMKYIERIEEERMRKKQDSNEG